MADARPTCTRTAIDEVFGEITPCDLTLAVYEDDCVYCPFFKVVNGHA